MVIVKSAELNGSAYDVPPHDIISAIHKQLTSAIYFVFQNTYVYICYLSDVGS